MTCFKRASFMTSTAIIPSLCVNMVFNELPLRRMFSDSAPQSAGGAGFKDKSMRERKMGFQCENTILGSLHQSNGLPDHQFSHNSVSYCPEDVQIALSRKQKYIQIVDIKRHTCSFYSFPGLHQRLYQFFSSPRLMHSCSSPLVPQ